MRFRPVVDLKGERMRDAYQELWRLVARRPPRSRPWRDFWKVFIPSFALLMTALAVFDATPFSPTGVVILAMAFVVTGVIGSVFRRIGLIAPRRRVPTSDPPVDAA